LFAFISQDEPVSFLLTTNKNILRYLLSKPKFKQFLTDITNCKISLTDMHLNNFGFKANGDFAILDLSFYEGSYEIDF